jgi:peptidoglycan hydrolase CwlO-like protein
VTDGIVTDGIEDAGQAQSALRRQLAERTAEVESLRAEVETLTAKLGDQDEQVVEWRAKAAEYDALMQTKTMHAVRIPRAIYGRILARRERDHGPTDA